MKKYFYSTDNKKVGPFSFEELKNENINKETLIWFEGLDNWTAAKYILEIEEILKLKPPPVQSNLEEVNFRISKTQDSNTSSMNSEANSKTTFLKKQSMFSNPFSFDGRIRRTEYGISFIIYVFTLVIVNTITKTGEYTIVGLAYIPMLWFLWAQGAKRCHDIGNNGWWQIIPLYVFWLFFQKGVSDINQYGAKPKV